MNKWSQKYMKNKIKSSEFQTIHTYLTSTRSEQQAVTHPSNTHDYPEGDQDNVRGFGGDGAQQGAQGIQKGPDAEHVLCAELLGEPTARNLQGEKTKKYKLP